MDWVDEVGLNHGVVGMLYRVGCMDNIYLEEETHPLVNLHLGGAQ